MYVYRFKNLKEEIIYIGRAKKLKERMNRHKHLPKECYDEVSKVEYITLSNDDESSIYERFLINKHLPKYNIEYKNNSTFTFNLPEKEWKIFNYDFLKESKKNYITITYDITKLEIKTRDIKKVKDKTTDKDNIIVTFDWNIWVYISGSTTINTLYDDPYDDPSIAYKEIINDVKENISMINNYTSDGLKFDTNDVSFHIY